MQTRRAKSIAMIPLTIELIIEGKPTALQRHRSMIRNNSIVCYDPCASIKNEISKQIMAQLAYKNELKYEMMKIEYFEAEFSFYFKYPYKSKRINHNFHNKRPDLSNLIKLYEDILQGILIPDDKLIVLLKAEKKYADTEFTKIILREIKC